MYRPIGIALLVIGVVLLVFGISATDSFSSDLSRLFRGTPTDRSIWLVVVGAASAVVGLVMSLAPRRGTRPL